MTVSTWFNSHYCTAQCQDLKCLDQKVKPGVLGTGISHLIQRGKKKILFLLNNHETAPQLEKDSEHKS